MKSTLERESKVLEIVEREAFDFSGCLVFGESVLAQARACSLPETVGWHRLGPGLKKAQELNCLNGFELRGCCSRMG